MPNRSNDEIDLMMAPSTPRRHGERKPLLDSVTVVHATNTCDKRSSTWMPRDKPGLDGRCPSQQSSCLGNLFFSWVTPIMRLGSERPLESHDQNKFDPYNRAANV
ncbi:hypothetical protein PsorP6_005988 [Peronosclerospora sorghi]|uniref:Uncharacterized protein n=1 Tax=Peronosclerospora sorghi TaxID=230839 RepID=A0ACC0W589_9STRA|nr:hypothetical protein PsorP6_005988 [Peronosclerospora sorghi]